MWLDQGALEYKECVADDANARFGVPFSRGVKGERRMDATAIPFDVKRMAYGGFRMLIDA